MARKKKRHELVIVVSADKPCSRAEAIKFTKDCIHGEFYPTSWNEDDVDEFRVITVKSRFREG